MLGDTSFVIHLNREAQKCYRNGIEGTADLAYALQEG